jgi:NTE family protein
VLGAGGIVGQAYHAGVLAALERDYGWDARNADVIVGTSAGAITGALLRSGISAMELAAWAVKARPSRGGRLRRAVGEGFPELEPFRLRHVFGGLPSLPRWQMLRHAIVHPWQFQLLTAALALLAPGRLDIGAQLLVLRDVIGETWPDRELWICAVRRRDGRRVVFGRPGAPEVALHQAIAASCAVPGYFAPVRIGNHTYVDGGAHSLTNAALLKSAALDLVVIVSPMSGPVRLPTDPYAATRWHAGRTLRREARALRAQGAQIVVFQPSPAEQQVIGNDYMARDRVTEIIQRAFSAASAHAARPQVRDLLSRPLPAPPGRRTP